MLIPNREVDQFAEPIQAHEGPGKIVLACPGRGLFHLNVVAMSPVSPRK